MGKAGRWLRSFLTGKKSKDKDKAKDKAESQSQPLALPTPAAKEKRRWSFRRPAATCKDVGPPGQGPLASTSSHGFLETQTDAAVTAVQAAAPRLKRCVVDTEDAAAIKIQSDFRSYLARKALCALRGMVKLQALVRGQLVRRQANKTLRRMEAIVAAQHRARAERLRLLEDDRVARKPWPPPSRRSMQHPRLRQLPEMMERGAEENVKIVEVDTGSEVHGTPRACARRSSSGYSTPVSRTPTKAELCYKVSPTPSALTDATARTYSGRFQNSPRRHQMDKACHADNLLCPSYMANTESSRAKARSQSAPRQRQPTSNGGCRASPEQAGARMEPSASKARAPCPWAVRLDKSCASLPDSECGSSSTVVTAATAHSRPVAAESAVRITR